MPKCASINRMILNMPGVLKMPKFSIRQYSEYDRVFKMRTLDSLRNIPEYALTEFCIYLGF